MKPFDPLFPDSTAKVQDATAFFINTRPVDPLAPRQSAVAKPSPGTVKAYTHIDAFTCPARGCGRPMSDATLCSGEVVSYCETHRITFPRPI